MPVAELKEALTNCVLNFDRRVMVTDLLQEYELNYAEVNEILQEHIRQQESSGLKFEKRFLVQGVEKDSSDEVYTLVQGEQKIKDWLQRLRNAEATLYSVEVAGGAKSPTYAFTTVHYHRIQLKSLEVKEAAVRPQGSSIGNSTANTSNGTSTKVETKRELKKPSGMDMFAKKTSAGGASTSSKPKTAEKPMKVSPETKKSSSPEEKKPKAGPAAKKGIGNFFAVAPKTEKKEEQRNADITKKKSENTTDKNKDNTIVKKTENATDKKIEKSTDIKPEKNIKKEANTSVQLFEDDSDQASSDEEEKLENLRRDVITSDNEDGNEKAASTSKRRRIIDSDEDEAVEEPQKKMEKKDTIDITEDDTPQQQSETYLDEEGFVITIKPKKASGAAKNSKPTAPTKVSPTRKSPPKAAAAKTSAKSAATKGKQGNIMNFFSKK